MQTHIIFIKIFLIINIINLTFLNYTLLTIYLSIFSNSIFIFIYFIVGFFIVHILKIYNYSGYVHTETKPKVLYTIKFNLKCQLKMWYKSIIHYRKIDEIQIPFICHFVLHYKRFLTISYIHTLMLHIFIHLLFLFIKILVYIIYTIILIYQYYILLKVENSKDLYSYNEYSIITQYTNFNISCLKFLFDEYGNFNWYYEEKFNANSYKEYLQIWFILYIIVKPYYVIFNHFIAITYIFSRKQLNIDSIWDENLNEWVSAYKKVNNVFTLKIKLIIFLIYFVSNFTGFIIRYFQNYMKNTIRLSLEVYIYQSSDLYIHKMQNIIWLSLGLSDLEKVSLHQWGIFKKEANFGHNDYLKYNFVKRITKDNENFIYVFPLEVHNTLPMRVIETINFVYTIIYGTKNNIN